MPIIGTNLGTSIASVSARPTERAPTEKRAERLRMRAGKSELSQDADAVELTDAVRSLKDNSQEEAHEDRQQTGQQYRPSGPHGDQQYGRNGRITPQNGSRPRNPLDANG